jgi:hypothetical protein
MTEPHRRTAGAVEGRERPQVGQLVAREMLGTEAVYRVLGENDRGIEVEVVRVPGLRPGSRFTFTLDAVLAMSALDPAAGLDPANAEKPRAAQTANPGLARRRFA